MKNPSAVWQVANNTLKFHPHPSLGHGKPFQIKIVTFCYASLSSFQKILTNYNQLL